MADQLLFEQSNESQMTTEPFVSRQVVYVIDQNNGSYSGQIQLDTSSLSNSGKYASYSEAYLEIPFVICAQPNAAIAGIDALAYYLNYWIGIKNGYHQLIHSLSVEYNNNSVIQLTPFTNFYISYKMMTSLSEGDVKKFGQSIGFYPDSSSAWNFNNGVANTPDGNGSINNRCFGWETLYPANNGYIYTDTATSGLGAGPALAGAGTIVVVSANTGAGAPLSGLYTTNLSSNRGLVQTVANYGFYKRLQMCGFNPLIPPYSTFTNTSVNFNTNVLKNYFLPQTNGGGNNSLANGNVPATQPVLAWYILARIRLKDVSDFFDKMPLVKGAYLRFIINYNTSSQTLTTVTVAAAAGQPASLNQYLSSTPTLTNGTNPLMIGSSQLGQGGQPVSGILQTGANNGWVVSCGVVSTTSTTGISVKHAMSSCRLYVPLYQMNPIQEQAYLSLNPTKTIIYRDIYQYSVSVDANGTFNNLLTNGIPNPKTIIIIPMIQSGSNYTGALQTVGISPYQSPFSSEPATTSPLISLTNFNVQIAGVNMFLQNELYDWEQFVNELSSQNCINGGLVDGLTSGLIGEFEFSNNYRYYVCDVSRRLPAEDKVPKSVQILGTNNSNIAITLFVFIEFEKQIGISLMTGEKLA